MAKLERAFHKLGTRRNANAREILDCTYDFSWSQAAEHVPTYSVRFKWTQDFDPPQALRVETLTASFTRKEVEHLVKELTELLERHKE